MASARLGRKHAAVAEFLEASQPLIQVANDGHGVGLMHLAEAFVQATATFGHAELTARRAERAGALGIDASGARLLQEQARSLNDKGRRLLKEARAAIREFRSDIATLPEAVDLGELADRAGEELRREVVDLEVKGTDAAKIMDACDQALAVARTGTPSKLADFLDSQLQEYERIRRRKDRGTAENIPIWKVAAIVVAVGVWVWALFRCGIFGACSFAEGLAYFVIFWLAALVARFC